MMKAKNLWKVLFSRINPSLKDQVGNDRGTQYRHGIYPHTDAQAEAAARAIARCQASLDAPVVTEVQRAAVFWPAEAYHRMPSRSSKRAQVALLPPRLAWLFVLGGPGAA